MSSFAEDMERLRTHPGVSARDARALAGVILALAASGPAEACRDCGATSGAKHDDGCDMARCLHTGQQRLACQSIGRAIGQEPHDCGEDAWPGYDPDAVQAARYGLWCWCPPTGSPVPCGPGHPEAIPNVTRLMRNGRWDREGRRWVLVDGAPLP